MPQARWPRYRLKEIHNPQQADTNRSPKAQRVGHQPHPAARCVLLVLQDKMRDERQTGFVQRYPL